MSGGKLAITRRPLGGARPALEDNTKMNGKEIECGGMAWGFWERLDRTKYRKFLGRLSEKLDYVTSELYSGAFVHGAVAGRNPQL
jgi:hypothetical protein